MGKRGRPPHPDILTPRQWQVLALLREGLTHEQIAHRLDVSFTTAKYHVAEIISKLGVQTREEAAASQPPPARPSLARTSRSRPGISKGRRTVVGWPTENHHCPVDRRRALNSGFSTYHRVIVFVSMTRFLISTG